MVFAKLVGPLRELLLDAFDEVFAAGQFNDVPLAILKANGFNALVSFECLSQAGGRVLATREQNQGRGVEVSH